MIPQFGILRWRLLSLLLVVAAWWALSSGVADASPRDACQTGGLKARVEAADLDFQHRGRMSTQVHSYMTVKVPDTWPHARDLILGEGSTEQRNAMHCLLRGNEEPGERAAEWRFHNPRVTAGNGWITVEYQAFAWIKQTGPFLIGPWDIDVGEKKWPVVLKPPDALKGADWKRVKVDLGGLGTTHISPEPSSVKDGELVWATGKSPGIRVDVDPPWQRYFVLTHFWLLLSNVGVASWWVCASVVMALAAVRALPRRPSSAEDESGSASRSFRRLAGGIGRALHNEGPRQAVLYWAVLSAAVVLTLLLLMKEIESPSWRALIGIATGLALVLVARPWIRPERPSAQKPGAEKSVAPGGQRRQARVVKVTASGVALLGVLMVAAPHLFGQGPVLKPTTQSPGHFGLVLLGLTTLWLGLAAMTAWAWRFAREGGLVRESWTERWDRAPARWVAVVSALLAAITAVILCCFWWATNLDWKRVTWPSERTGTPREVSEFLVGFPLLSLTWVYAYSWVLAGIALVALLRIRVEKQRSEGNRLQRVSLGPEGPDFLLTAALFAFLVGLRQLVFAGASAAFYGLWFLLIILSLYALRSVGRRRSVLSLADGQFLSQTFGTPERMHELLKRSHEYRNCHHQIYLMEHGRMDGAEREELEEEVREQGRWLSGQGPKHPAEVYSVVDVALAWGPGPHWWDNARHAAKLAFVFGIPASFAVVWLTSFPDHRTWLFTLHTPNGLLEIVAKFCAWQIAWAGAGMVLGALWRVLPGRRSPVRALSLTVAYALPVGVGALLSRITDTELSKALLYVMFMLIILTLTSLWLDMSTFREERQFWPTSFGLLLSIYQLRGIATQTAYVLALMATAAAIWRDLATSVTKQ
ncbi:DUF6185 family protein [Streptomyces jumonjinensis]|uniref:DUF6185 family protein n=1 Tax=Streptomyces jumonjinensis TaxID=1945 RepID=UPI0037AA086C